MDQSYRSTHKTVKGLTCTLGLRSKNYNYNSLLRSDLTKGWQSLLSQTQLGDPLPMPLLVNRIFTILIQLSSCFTKKDIRNAKLQKKNSSYLLCRYVDNICATNITSSNSFIKACLDPKEGLISRCQSSDKYNLE